MWIDAVRCNLMHYDTLMQLVYFDETWEFSIEFGAFWCKLMHFDANGCILIQNYKYKSSVDTNRYLLPTILFSQKIDSFLCIFNVDAFRQVLMSFLFSCLILCQPKSRSKTWIIWLNLSVLNWPAWFPIPPWPNLSNIFQPQQQPPAPQPALVICRRTSVTSDLRTSWARFQASESISTGCLKR